MPSVIKRRGETQGEGHVKEAEQSEAAVVQGAQQSPSPELATHSRALPRASEGSLAHGTWIPDSWPPDLGENTFLFV